MSSFEAERRTCQDGKAFHARSGALHPRAAVNQPKRHLRIAASVLMLGAALPALAQTPQTQTQTQAPAPTPTPTPENPAPESVVITAQGVPLIDVAPEQSYDEQRIRGYGQSTVEDLLGQVMGELGDDDEMPAYLVN